MVRSAGLGFRLRSLRGLKHPLSLLAALALGCAAIIGLDGWRTFEARRDAIRTDQTETANLARSLAQHAQDTFHLLNSVLQSLRERAETDGLTAERLRRVMRAQLASLPGLNGLFIYDSSGARIATSQARATEEVNISDRAYFQHHRNHPDRGMLIGKPVYSKAEGVWVLTASLRLDDADGRFAGVLLATLPVSYLAEFFNTFDVGPSGSLTLTTADGTVIASSPSDVDMTGRDLSHSEIFSTFLSQAESGSFQDTSVTDGVVRLGSYRRVPDFPLVVIVGHGLDKVLLDWRLTAALHTGISSVLAALLALIGWKFIRQGLRIRRAERHYRLLADNSCDAIMCVSLDGRWLYVSPAFTTLTGWNVDEVMKTRWGELVHPDDQESSRETAARLRSGESNLSSTYRYMCKSGHALWVEARLKLVPATDDEQAQYVMVIRDITERKNIEEQLAASNRELEVQACTDGLTGVANRRRFDAAFSEEWRRGAREDTPLSLLMIDVDRFKLFNDGFGHGAGDGCLAAVAATIAGCVHRPGDLVARYGGEEIGVVLPNTSRSGAMDIAETIRAAVQGMHIPHERNSPFEVVTVSIGAATRYPQLDRDKEAGGALELAALADAALYHAKNTGRNKVCGEHDLPDKGSPPCLPDEAERLAAVASYGLGDGSASIDSLDRIARLTSVLFQAPIALISLIGSERQCFLGRTGLDIDGTSRQTSFCAHAIAGKGVFTVADATADPRFADNPFVKGEPQIRFYAGAPLVGAGRHHLGALCVIDQKPRPPLSPDEKALLRDLADLAVSYLDQQRLNNGHASMIHDASPMSVE